MTRRGTRITTALALLIAVHAFAQVEQAPGIKIGEGQLHPFLQLDGRYDSLVGYFGPNNSASGEIILHVRPGLSFGLDNASTFINFTGSGEYLWYTGLLSPSSTQLSRFQANVALDTKFNRDGAVEVDLGDNLTRSDRTQNPALGVGVLSLYNSVYLQAPIRPGGRALEITPKVNWGIEFFEPLLQGFVPGCTSGNTACDPLTVSQSNYSNLNFGIAAKYKFLPKTAIILDVNTDWRAYLNATQNQKFIFRALAGLAGLISPRIAVTLLAGYAGDFSNGSLHTVIGNAEVSYTVSEQSRVAVGYNRSFAPVPVYGAYVDDRGYLRGGLGLFGGRLLLNAQLSADYLSYITQPDNPLASRNDFILGVSAGPQVFITSWFDVSATYGLTFRTSTAALQSLNFPRHEVMLRLNFHY